MNLNKMMIVEAWDQNNPGNDEIIPLAKANPPMVRGSGLFNSLDVSQGYWRKVWDKPFKYLALMRRYKIMKIEMSKDHGLSRSIILKLRR